MIDSNIQVIDSVDLVDSLIDVNYLDYNVNGIYSSFDIRDTCLYY